MTTLALLTEPIAGTDGIPAGHDDWRFVIRIAQAPSDAVLGTMILGTDPLTDIVWIDVTADAHGVHIERGAVALQRPGAGQIDFWLDNDSGAYDRWQSIYNGPGAMVQVLLGTPTDTRHIITALVTNWAEASAAEGALRRVEVTGIETIALLLESDLPAVAPVGAGEALGPRVLRIITNASWQFGGVVDVDAPHDVWTFQATSLAQPAWGELLLTCDSVGAQAVSAKDGSLSVTEYDRGLLAVGLRTLGVDVPTVSDSVKVVNDDDVIIGQINLSRAGGSAVAFLNSGIQGRYQLRSKQRYDLITQDPGGNADLARVADVLYLGRGSEAYRVESVELDTGHGGAVWEFLSLVDIGTKVHVDRPDTVTTGILFSNYLVAGYALTVSTVTETEVLISAEIRTSIQSSSTWERYT